MNKLTALIARDFQLEKHTHAEFSDDEMLQWLADEVAYMLEYRTEFLMSLMYRLDIIEAKVSAAISPVNPIPANIALAQLIIDRQKERIFTKSFYKQANLEDLDEELKW